MVPCLAVVMDLLPGVVAVVIPVVSSNFGTLSNR
jgi:hypothetical protein